MVSTGLSFESTAKRELPCSQLSFCAALMLQRRKGICTEMPTSGPCPYSSLFSTLICCCQTLSFFHFYFLFCALPLQAFAWNLSALPSLPVSTKVTVSKFVLNQRQSQRETHVSQVSASRDGMAPTTVLAAENWQMSYFQVCCPGSHRALVLQPPARQRSPWYLREGLLLFWKALVCPWDGESASAAAVVILTGFAGDSLLQRLMFPPQKQICLPLEGSCSPGVAAAAGPLASTHCFCTNCEYS